MRLYTLLSAIGRKPFSRRLPTQSPGDEEAEGAADQVSGDTTSGGAVRVVQEGCICAVDERVARGVRRLAHGGAISSKLGRVSRTSRSRTAVMREEQLFSTVITCWRDCRNRFLTLIIAIFSLRRWPSCHARSSRRAPSLHDSLELGQLRVLRQRRRACCCHSYSLPQPCRSVTVTTRCQLRRLGAQEAGGRGGDFTL